MKWRYVFLVLFLFWFQPFARAFPRATSFRLGPSYSAGFQPSSIAVGDLNGDGKADLVVANAQSDSVSIFLGNGDGTLRAAGEYRVGAVPRSVVIGDFNRDGKLDVAVANSQSDTISVLLGNGDGTFREAVEYRVGAGPRSLAIGDFNGDQRRDLAVANADDGTVSILLGQGDGSFRDAGTYRVESQPAFVAVADLNGGHKLDVVVANAGSRTVSVLLGNGDGTFQAARNYPVGREPTSVAIADFNGHHKLDLAVTSRCALASCANGTVSLLAGNGDGTFRPAVHYPVGSNPQSAIAADFELSGKLGLAVANFDDNSVTVLSGRGAETFRGATHYGVGVNPVSVAVGDFNHDGKPDLAVANQFSNSVSLLLNATSGPGVTFSPTSLTFPTQVVGTSSPPQNVTLTNSGDATLSITSITVTGTNSSDFTQTNTCGASVAAGASCTITVTFKPRGNGARSASISVSDNAAGSPQAVPLTGTGTFAELTPSSLIFPAQALGTTSAPQTVTLTNTASKASMNITSISITGTNASEFAETNNCGTSLAAGASCTINVTFTPTTSGFPTADVSVADNGGGSPQLASLSGVAGTPSGPAASLSPGSLTFPTEAVGLSAPSQAATLSNVGTQSLSITSITITGSNPKDFTQTNTCGTSVAAGASCTITVTFTPRGNGTRTATLSITDNSPNSPQNLSLAGTGTFAELTPNSLSFGNEPLNTTSPPQTVTFTNVASKASLSITGITITGTNASEFGETNTCGSSLAAGASCTISVTFTPTVNGNATADLSVSDNAGGSPQLVSLSGFGGTPAGPAVTLSPSSIVFPTTVVNATSTQTVTLSSTGTEAVSITSIAITGTDTKDFAETNACPSSLNVGSSCTISVTFTPHGNVSFTADVTVTDNASNSPQNVSLTGQGTFAEIMPSSINFGAQSPGTTSSPQTVTLTNTALKAAMNITSITITGTNSADFAETNTCGTSLAAGASCTVSVTFTPSAVGNESATLNFNDNGGGSPQTVSLSGVGSGPPAVTLSSTSLTFAPQVLNTTSPPQTVTLTNSGGSSLTITSITITGTAFGAFAQTNTCGSSVAVGASCTISVTFTPKAIGSKTASVSISDNASGSPQTVSLTGIGTAVELSATSLVFGSQTVGTTSAPQNVTMTNVSSSDTISITSISIIGVNKADFAETNTCGTSLAPGANCTISVTFTPTATGTRTASVSISDNGGASPQTISLTGTGT